MRIFDAGSDACLRDAAALLRDGGLVVLPTETVYGLAADAANAAAVERVYAIKGRDAAKALPVMVEGIDTAETLCRVGSLARKWMERFWPGPLTLVLPSVGSAGTLGIRCPGHGAALTVLRYAARPLVLTSANLSGQPEPRKASEVTLAADGLVDGGECAVGIPSTVVDLSGDKPVLLRSGAVCAEELGL